MSVTIFLSSFSEPEFVSAYEIDDFVYFFFKEAAIEYINCGKVKKKKSPSGGFNLLKFKGQMINQPRTILLSFRCVW